MEFLRRFLTHVLPKGFVRIRHYGFMANSQRKAQVARCRALLKAQTPTAEDAPPPVPPPEPALDDATANCPHCGVGHWQRVWEAPRPCRAELFLLPLWKDTLWKDTLWNGAS